MLDYKAQVRAIINLPRVYLSAGNFFLDFGWFATGDAPRYGPTLLFEKIDVESHSVLGRGFTSLVGGLSIQCGERELAITGGWSNADEHKKVR